MPAVVHEALQAAATALLPTASEPMLRRILRELLADEDPASAQASNAPARTAPGAELAERALSRPHKSAQPPKNGQEHAGNGRDAPDARLDRAGSANHPTTDGSANPFADWPTLRHRIQTAMTQRGITFDQLAVILGYAPETLRQAVGTNKPKTRRITERLGAWFEDPHAVIAAVAEAPAKSRPPFRAGAGRAGARASSGAAAA